MSILIDLSFFQSMSQGWLDYSNKSSSPKFTEEQIRSADQVAEVLTNCYPITELIDPTTHMEICQSLRQGQFAQDSIHLENEVPTFTIRGWCQ
jgi:hypothetical protein